MSTSIESRIITAALPFSNAIPHLGNIVGSHLPADIFTRYCRLLNYRTIFVGGTDEHGTATELAAHQRGVTPRELCDELYQRHQEIYRWFGISYDNFSRTSRPLHHQTAQRFCQELFEKGLIVEGTLRSAFCEECHKGLADRFIIGTCPECGFESANGDQCESCGRTNEAEELITPRCVTCKGTDVKFKESKHLFLDLRPVQPAIQAWLESNQQLRKQVKNLAFGWLKQGLKPRCITRDLEWGIPVPIPGYESKVLYVWFENVVGYISATIELLGEEGAELWKHNRAKIYHFFAKDNITFHTIYWPGELLGVGDYSLPYNSVGYQFLTTEEQKFSKSKGIGIFADDVLRSNIHADYWRFYLTYLIPETADTNFSAAEFKERVNGCLVAKYGNLIHRTLSLVYNRWRGQIPEIDKKDPEFESSLAEGVKKVLNAYEHVELRRALEETLLLCDLGNAYINHAAPWKTGDGNAVAYVLELGRIVTILLSPIIPTKATEVLHLLNTDSRSLELQNTPRPIPKPLVLFPRLESV